MLSCSYFKRSSAEVFQERGGASETITAGRVAQESHHATRTRSRAKCGQPVVLSGACRECFGFALDVVKTAWEKSGSPAKDSIYLFVVLRSWRNGVVVVLENTLFIAKTLREIDIRGSHGWTAQPRKWKDGLLLFVSNLIRRERSGNAFEGSGSRWSLLRGVPIWKQPAGGYHIDGCR